MTVGQGSPHVGTGSWLHTATVRGWLVCVLVTGFLLVVGSNSVAQQMPTENRVFPGAGVMPTDGSSQAPVSNLQVTSGPASEKVAFELRIVWGGGTARSFQGTISIEDGAIKLVRNLSLQADSIGSISAPNAATLEVNGHSASTFGGADVSILGALTSRITVRFTNPTTNQPLEHSFLVSEVLGDRWLRKLDDQGNRVAAERQMQDRLRVRPSQPVSIYQPSSTWMGTLSGYRCGLPAGEYQLSTRLLDQNNSDAIISEDEKTVTIDDQGGFNVSSLEVPLPQIESSYSIEFSLVRKRFLQSFVRSSETLKRRLDLVVFDKAAPSQRITGWTPVATIRPLDSQWWNAGSWFAPIGSAQSLGSLASFSEAGKRPVSHGSQATRKVDDKDCLTLGPSAWQAYPLAVDLPGEPHRLRVRVPKDRAQQLVISIRDFHENGEPTTLNVDSGIVLGERQASAQANDKAHWAEHEVIFWPRSSKPIVLMLNASNHEEAAFGEVQLEVAQRQLIEPFQGSGQATKVNAGSNAPRMTALYLTKPLVADAFGAQRKVDPITKRALDSWLTWQQSCTRIAQYMQVAGYNTLVLNVASDGGSVLPISQLEATTRFDSGTFFSDGRSPEIKDFVELLCNHLDRSGLQLILSMNLNSPLPGLSKWEIDDSKNAGLVQTNLEGKNWPAESEQSHRRILYNPLHARVQTELEQIIRSVSNRYAGHPCFKGVTLELGESSHVIFAGDRWGYDDATLRKYESATQSKLPTRDALPSAMQGALRLAFLNWRARELSEFHVRLADIVRSAKADAKLFLNPVALWQRQPSQEEYVDPTAASRNLSDTLLSAGIDAGSLKPHTHIAILRGQSECALGSDLERAWLSRAASDAGLLYASLGNTSGTVQLHKPIGIVIPEAQKLQSFGAMETQQAPAVAHPTWCYPIAANLGPEIRKGLIEQLYREDSLLVADGTWMPPQGDTTQLAMFRRTLTELPNVPMQTVKIDRDDSNVRLRSVKVGSDTYLQLINNASWTEQVTMDVKIAAINGVYEVLGGRELKILGDANSSQSSSRVDANGTRMSTVWQFEIPPYDLIAFKITDPQFKLNSFIHSPDPSLIAEMKSEIDDLENMMALVSDTARAESLDVLGGDFEQWVDGGRPLGWTVSTLPQVSIRQESSLPHSGSSCVLIENRNQSQVSAWMQSEKIRIPESGRLVVTAWVRVPAAGKQPQVLRLSLIGRTHDGRRYQRSHQFGPQPAGAEIAIDWGKRPVTLFVTDLPSADLAELYVAFDLVGPGRVWVDDIQAQEAYLSPDERIQIRGQIFLAKEKLRDNNAYPAEQVLSSHLARYLASINSRQRLSNNKQQDVQQVNTLESNTEKTAPGGRWNNSPPILQQLRESMRERWQR